MRRCLDLALNGLGRVSPNPMVGAVIVHNNRVIGEGFHTGYGNAHAEVEAIRSVREEAQSLLNESTLYVNLEPCSHHGKTPPCVDRILESGIRRVVMGGSDPNPLVNGNGVQKLRDNGVEVIEDVLHNDCRDLNNRFYLFHEMKRPFVLLKWAQSLDGFITSKVGTQVQVSNAITRLLSHKWRSEESAILVGFHTAKIDNPRLTIRNWKGSNPLRVVYDRNCALPRDLHLFNAEAETWVINHVKEETNQTISYKKVTAENWIDETLSLLRNAGHASVMVEGGSQTLAQFIERDLWDEARVFVSSESFFDGLSAPVLQTFARCDSRCLGDNTLNVYQRR